MRARASGAFFGLPGMISVRDSVAGMPTEYSAVAARHDGALCWTSAVAIELLNTCTDVRTGSGIAQTRVDAALAHFDSSGTWIACRQSIGAHLQSSLHGLRFGPLCLWGWGAHGAYASTQRGGHVHGSILAWETHTTLAEGVVLHPAIFSCSDVRSSVRHKRGHRSRVWRAAAEGRAGCGTTHGISAARTCGILY